MMNERKDNAVIGFWLLFHNIVPKQDIQWSKDREFYKYDLAEPNGAYFDAIKDACLILINKNTNVFILIEDEVDEYILNIIRHKLYQYKVPYSKLINSKEGLESVNSMQMVINQETNQPEFVNIDLI